jgi:RimJ/RimL family protein N-acetyltransferase
MSVVRHSDVEAFLAAAAPALARSEPTHALYTALARGLQQSPEALAKPYYLATYDDGVHCGAAVQSEGGPIVLEDADPVAAAAFASDYPRDGRELREVVGVPEACAAFAAVWQARAACTSAVGVRMRHHVLATVADVPPVPGAMREATAADEDWLVAAQLAFVADAGIREPAERIRRVVPERLAQGRFRVWCVGDEIVSYVGWIDAGPRFGRIAPVWTPAAHRRRGYATAAVAALARELLARGKERVFLVTDLANPTANAIYARIGFAPLHDVHRLDFRPLP